MALFKRNDIIEYCMKLNWYMFVNVAFAEKPFFIFAGLDNFLKKCMKLKSFKNINTKAFF